MASPMSPLYSSTHSSSIKSMEPGVAGSTSEHIPMGKVRPAADLLREKHFPSDLPERTNKRSRCSNIIHNRIFQIAMGILLALALIAGGGVLGVVLGKKKAPVAERPTLPAVTTTPPIKTVHATTTVVDVIGTLTTTPTVTTTVFIAPSSGGRMGNSDD